MAQIVLEMFFHIQRLKDYQSGFIYTLFIDISLSFPLSLPPFSLSLQQGLLTCPYCSEGPLGRKQVA